MVAWNSLLLSAPRAGSNRRIDRSLARLLRLWLNGLTETEAAKYTGYADAVHNFLLSDEDSNPTDQYIGFAPLLLRAQPTASAFVRSEAKPEFTAQRYLDVSAAREAWSKCDRLLLRTLLLTGQ